MKNDTKNPWKGLWSPSTWQVFETDEENLENPADLEEEVDKAEWRRTSPSDERPHYWSTSILSRYKSTYR